MGLNCGRCTGVEFLGDCSLTCEIDVFLIIVDATLVLVATFAHRLIACRSIGFVYKLQVSRMERRWCQSLGRR